MHLSYRKSLRAALWSMNLRLQRLGPGRLFKALTGTYGRDEEAQRENSGSSSDSGWKEQRNL